MANITSFLLLFSVTFDLQGTYEAGKHWGKCSAKDQRVKQKEEPLNWGHTPFFKETM